MANPTFTPLYVTASSGPFTNSGHVVDVAGRILGKAVDLLRNDGNIRYCGVLTVMSEATFPIALSHGFIWGDPDDSEIGTKLAKYAIISAEKAQRLWWMHAQRGDVTSYESRDPKVVLDRQWGPDPWGKWGGAILCRTSKIQVFSFSGFPELWDEAAMILLAQELACLFGDDKAINSVTKRNPHLARLSESCG